MKRPRRWRAGLLGLPHAFKRRVLLPRERAGVREGCVGKLTCFKLLVRRRRAVCVVVMGERRGAAEALGSRLAGPREPVLIRAGEA